MRVSSGFETKIEHIKLQVNYEIYNGDVDLMSVYLANDVKEEVDIYDLLSDKVQAQISDEISEHYYGGEWK